MKIRISILLLFLGLSSCEKKEIQENKFIGTWYDTEYVVPNLTIIKIKTDSTFSCTSGACAWQGFSYGKWKMIGDSLELNSVKIDTCYDVSTFIDCHFFDKNSEPIMTIPGCKPDTPGSYIFFDKEKFYIKNDSLVYKLKSSSGCPDTLKIAFAKTQKTRK
jgi:hypothetical protein